LETSLSISNSQHESFKKFLQEIESQYLEATKFLQTGTDIQIATSISSLINNLNQQKIESSKLSNNNNISISSDIECSLNITPVVNLISSLGNIDTNEPFAPLCSATGKGLMNGIIVGEQLKLL
jgi:2-hydroxy-3-keto-5-methylthiopentenyl-1-phosphate phosphatase